jgi:hypothetical protein
MKLAKLGPRKGIWLKEAMDQSSNHLLLETIELTDEQAAKVESLRAEDRIPIWFENRVTTRRDESIGHNFQWDQNASSFIKTAIV